LLCADRVTGVDSVTWPSVVLDSSSLLLLTVALYSQTATLIAVDRYWHHNYKSTGDVRIDCVHLSRPAAVDRCLPLQDKARLCSESANLHQSQNLNQIHDSKPDSNVDSDPDFCQIAPKMLWIPGTANLAQRHVAGCCHPANLMARSKSHCLPIMKVV